MTDIAQHSDTDSAPEAQVSGWDSAAMATHEASWNDYLSGRRSRRTVPVFLKGVDPEGQDSAHVL